MITVTTPSVRPELIPIVYKCLKRETFRNFEWLIGTPGKYVDEMEKIVEGASIDITIVEEPPKREGDYYGLNKCWNELFRNARGELIANIVDGLWFDPDLLDRLWNHYMADKMSCISCVGHQYDKIKNGKPENLVWKDPRVREGVSFYEVKPTEMELCIASIPTAGIFEVGGIDEAFDAYAALSEKELMYRMERRNYRFFIDQSIEYRAIKHPRLSADWDEKYNQGCEYYVQCLNDIATEKRQKLNYL